MEALFLLVLVLWLPLVVVLRLDLGPPSPESEEEWATTVAGNMGTGGHKFDGSDCGGDWVYYPHDDD